MPLGFDNTLVVSVGDTADLYVSLSDQNDQPVTDVTLIGVDFIIQKPDRSRSTVTGEVLDGGQGHLLYDDVDQEGEYRAIARFTLDSGAMQSKRVDFAAIDPFVDPVPTDLEEIVERVWNKVTDCFDSENGGPWLRDMTLAVFSKNRIPEFIDDALFDINVTNPPTNLVVTDFFLNDGTAPPQVLLAQGTFLAVIRHLMRSYTEQPMPQGAQIVYEDRRDYLTRWGTVYQLEHDLYDHWVKLWKRKFLGLGHSKQLVDTKAGRLLPAPLRTRNVGRGYYVVSILPLLLMLGHHIS